MRSSRLGLRMTFSGVRVLAVLSLSAIAAFVTTPGVSGAGKDTSTGDKPPARLAYIDEMIRKGWEKEGVKPSREASEDEFLRRVYLDLLGRTPNIQEAMAYLGSKEKGKRTKLVGYLLNQPEFAKNFANQWTVLLVGRRRQEREVDKDALTAWLRRQFLDERPWDRMVYDLVTAKGSNKENGAVNFALAHLEQGAVPLTSLTTRLFLGQQLQCTQCHDHPSNEWKQADFWGINAFFKGMKKETIRKADATGAEMDDHTELSDEPTDAYSQYDRRNGLVGVAFPRFLDGRKISQGTDVERRNELGKMVADPENLDLAKAFVNRMWGHLLGRGFVHPVDDFGPHNPASNPELLERLAKDFQKSHYDVKALIQWITTSQAYNLSSVMTKSNDKDESLFSHMALKPMTPEQLFDSLLTATSAHKAGGDDSNGKKRQQWLNQFVFAFSNDEGDEGSSFQGTIPQALMMMNGDLMEQATGGKPGSFLNDLMGRAERQNKTTPVHYMVNNLYLASLGRYPRKQELDHAGHYLDSFPDTIYVLEDLFWSLLNSNEFVLNH